MEKRPLRQLSTYLMISYIFAMFLSILNLTMHGNGGRFISIIIVLALVGFFTWGASRIYTKESRGWFRTLRIFFFIGVFFILLHSIAMLFSAVKDPTIVYHQLMMLFFPKGGIDLSTSISVQQAVNCWGVFTSLTVLPLIPLWFLFSNAGKYFKDRKEHT